VLVDDDHLAGLELALERRAHDVERRCLGCEHPSAVEAAEAQRAEAVGVAHAVDPMRVGQHEGERAAQLRQHRGERALELVIDAPWVVAQVQRKQLGHHVGVGGGHAVQHARLLGELGGVGEIAVVRQRELGVSDVAEDRL
jgi:hypothetical protein